MSAPAAGWKRARRQAALSLALAGSGISLLIWAKLRIVGGVPRSAYAGEQDAAPPLPNPEPPAMESESPTPDQGATSDHP